MRATGRGTHSLRTHSRYDRLGSRTVWGSSDQILGLELPVRERLELVAVNANLRNM